MEDIQLYTPEKDIAALAAALCVKVDAYVKTGHLLALQDVNKSATTLFHHIRKHYGWEEFGRMLDAVGVQQPDVDLHIDMSDVENKLEEKEKVQENG